MTMKMPMSSNPNTSLDDVRLATEKLLAYCRANEWAGYDPYDAVNSRLFAAVPLLNSRIPRLVLTQLLKRSPLNIRSLLLIPKTQNPKALAVFLAAFVKLSKGGFGDHGDLIPLMVQRLKELRSEGVHYWCWGYSFPWQTRTSVVPTRTPNLVCTSFVANALLDAYEQFHDPELLSMAVSAAEYILNELYWTDGSTAAGFSYPLPSVRVHVHNANLLGAALLCRAYKYTRDKKFLAPALRVARYSASKQELDGSWFYGEASTQRWIDNFHTGYNLGALRSICDDLESNEFEPNIRRGFTFYRDHFFREDGAARYFHNRTYPIDIHCVAQSIITLVTFRDLDLSNIPLAHSVFRWAMDHMWDDRGYFFYRVLWFCTIRISYMRWSQAWMLLALATLLCESEEPATRVSVPHQIAAVH
jgi:hypothetical protein